MFLKQEFNLIITIIEKGFSDPVISASKSAGAEGATIITARGTGIHENDTFLGVAIQPEKEIVMILVKKAIRKKVMRAICKACGLDDEGKGMTFSIPVDEIGGISHLMSLARGRHSNTEKKSADKGKGAKTEPKKEARISANEGKKDANPPKAEAKTDPTKQQEKDTSKSKAEE